MAVESNSSLLSEQLEAIFLRENSCVAEEDCLNLAEAVVAQVSGLYYMAPELYDAARCVISCWERGDLANAVRALSDVVAEIDENEDARG